MSESPPLSNTLDMATKRYHSRLASLSTSSEEGSEREFEELRDTVSAHGSSSREILTNDNCLSPKDFAKVADETYQRILSEIQSPALQIVISKKIEQIRREVSNDNSRLFRMESTCAVRAAKYAVTKIQDILPSDLLAVMTNQELNNLLSSYGEIFMKAFNSVNKGSAWRYAAHDILWPALEERMSELRQAKEVHSRVTLQSRCPAGFVDNNVSNLQQSPTSSQHSEEEASVGIYLGERSILFAISAQDDDRPIINLSPFISFSEQGASITEDCGDFNMYNILTEPTVPHDPKVLQLGQDLQSISQEMAAVLYMQKAKKILYDSCGRNVSFACVAIPQLTSGAAKTAIKQSLLMGGFAHVTLFPCAMAMAMNLVGQQPTAVGKIISVHHSAKVIEISSITVDPRHGLTVEKTSWADKPTTKVLSKGLSSMIEMDSAASKPMAVIIQEEEGCSTEISQFVQTVDLGTPHIDVLSIKPSDTTLAISKYAELKRQQLPTIAIQHRPYYDVWIVDFGAERCITACDFTESHNNSIRIYRKDSGTDGDLLIQEGLDKDSDKNGPLWHYRFRVSAPVSTEAVCTFNFESDGSLGIERLDGVNSRVESLTSKFLSEWDREALLESVTRCATFTKPNSSSTSVRHPSEPSSMSQSIMDQNQLHDTTEVSIGIDLGTTNSCVGFYRNGAVEIIKVNESYTIPSCTFFEEDGTITVGKSAQDGAFRSPENFIYDAKRLIGRQYKDFIVQDDMKNWHFHVVNDNNQSKIRCRGGDYRPEEISAKVLAYLKQLAEGHLGQQVRNAVVTVPAYFNEGQRQATKDAAEMAGLSASILTEPVAAAIAYGFHRVDNSKKNVLVFDLGGGTFDVAILSIENRKISVLTINGDTHLGGEDFDKAMVKHVTQTFCNKTGKTLFNVNNNAKGEDAKQSHNILRRLKFECERKKRDLSYANVACIRLEDIGLAESMTKKEFEEIIFLHLAKCIVIVDQALKDAQLSKSEINDVILVGGSTKIPKVRELLEQYFKRPLRHTVGEDQAVAKGAAIFAAMQNGSVGQDTDFVVADVTPLSIGIKDASGNFIVQVPKSSPLPFSKKGIWTNIVEGQRECVFEIYEGEDSLAKNNHFLGKFVLHIPPAISTLRIESHTEVNEEGIVTIGAVCLADNKKAGVNIDALKGRMTQKELKARKTVNPLRWK